MLRISTALALAATLLLLSAAARAEEESPGAHGDHEHASTTTTVVYDVSDVAKRVPELANRLKALLPDAQVKQVRQPPVVIVRATQHAHEDLGLLLAALRRDLLAPGDGVGPEAAVQRALEHARANADTLAALRTRRVSMRVEDAPGGQVLRLLAMNTDTNMIVSPKANARLQKEAFDLQADDATARLVLDLVLETSGLRLVLEAGIVRIVAADELEAKSFHLGFVEEVSPGSLERETPSETEWEEAARGGKATKGEPAELESLVRALHEEVRALRKEVREVRAILEALRDR